MQVYFVVCGEFVEVLWANPNVVAAKPFQSTDFYALSTEFPFVVMCDVVFG